MGRDTGVDHLETRFEGAKTAERDDADPELKATLRHKLFGEPVEPSKIGRYLVTRRIGTGGTGRVYAAFDPELDRKVAIKLLHPRKAGDEQMQARLLREAQALAKLTHPNVVTVHDVGIHEDQVFLVMELVAGATLKEWMASAARGWREVVHVFVQAGRGLVAAHAAGLVHRDFKPANVLLGDDGRVQVADFGLVRATTGEPPPELSSEPLSPDTTGSSIRQSVGDSTTATGAVLGTPAYMSPEQHQAHETDERTDQYSFCVSLYEGLYGHRPFRAKDRDALVEQVLAGRIRDAPTSTEVPARLRRIVLRGLSVDPAARWSSMSELLDELERDPGRVIRRGAFVGVLLLGAVTTAVIADRTLGAQSDACTHGAEEIAEAWNEATRGRLRGNFAASDAFYAADTWDRVEPKLDAYARQWALAYDDACAATHVRGEQSQALLDRRVSCLRSRRVEFEALLGAFEELNEKVIRNAIGASAELSPLEACADTDALMAQVAPPDDPATAAEVERIREVLAKSRALESAARFEQARELLEPELEIARSLDYRPILPALLTRIGFMRQRTGDPKGAFEAMEAAYFEALATQNPAAGLEAASALVFFYGGASGDAQTGLQWAKSAQALLEAAGLEGTAAHARLLSNIGSAHKTAVDLVAAEAAQRESIEVWEAVETDHPGLAIAYANLATTLERAGRYDEALSLQRRALEHGKERFGANHPNVGLSYNNLGNVYTRLGRLEEAREAYDAALSTFENAFGADHFYVAGAMTNVASSAMSRGDLDRAEELNLRAKEIFANSLGPEHVHQAYVEINLCSIDYARNELDAALEHCKRADALRRKSFGDEHPDVAETMQEVALIEGAMGLYEAAIEKRRQAIQILERALGGKSNDLMAARTALAIALLEAGRPTEAQKQIALAFEIVSEDSPKAVHLRLARARTRLAQGDATGALEDARWVRGELAHSPDAVFSTRPRADFALAQAMVAAGEDPEEARGLAEGARDALADTQAWPRIRAEIQTWLDGLN